MTARITVSRDPVKVWQWRPYQMHAGRREHVHGKLQPPDYPKKPLFSWLRRQS